MVKTQLFPLVGIVTASAINTTVRTGKLALMLILVAGIAARVINTEDHGFGAVDGSRLVAFLTEYVAVPSGEREFASRMIILHHKPALDIMTAHAAFRCDACIKLPGMRVLMAGLAREVCPGKAERLLSLYLRHGMAAAAGNGFMCAAQRKLRLCVLRDFEMRGRKTLYCVT